MKTVFACCDRAYGPAIEREPEYRMMCRACGADWDEPTVFALAECGHASLDERGGCEQCGLVMCSAQIAETPAEYCDLFAVHDYHGEPLCTYHREDRAGEAWSPKLREDM